jgi:hypothetical protein
LATASDSESKKSFRENYNKIETKNRYFFSATPKDIVGYDEDDFTDEFLMNNEKIFGERIGITIKEAIAGSYIPKPAIHLSLPENYLHTDMENVTNLSVFIENSFVAHSKQIENDSNVPEKLAPKILVKCSNVDQMWALKEILYKYCNSNNIRLFAGASRKQSTNDAEYQMDNNILTKSEHLDSLQKLQDHEKAIVLHYDTLSEGINVAGFTGVMFLNDMPPTIMKLLQNIGRALRLHEDDRVAIRNRYIDSLDYSKWIKPYAYIILPVYNPESEESQKTISNIIFNLRDKGIESSYLVSIGSDKPKADGKIPVPENKDPRVDVQKKLVQNIEHYIENFQNNAKENKENEILASLVGLDKKLNYLKTLY